ncbi:MAG TPA: hypothetical protein VNJ31_00025 [Methyloceanibacter sp.]|nr:hypothetical protein [Methyloceanibacter sp.]
MRAFLVFIAAIALVAFIQSERNDCYWHGRDAALQWIGCLFGY